MLDLVDCIVCHHTESKLLVFQSFKLDRYTYLLTTLGPLWTVLRLHTLHIQFVLDRSDLTSTVWNFYVICYHLFQIFLWYKEIKMRVAQTMVDKESLQSFIPLSELFFTVSELAFITSLTNSVFLLINASSFFELFGFMNADSFDYFVRLNYFLSTDSFFCMTEISLAHIASGKALRSGHIGDKGLLYITFLSLAKVKIMCISNFILLTKFKLLRICQLLL